MEQENLAKKQKADMLINTQSDKVGQVVSSAESALASDKWLTVKEASQITGKSTSSLRKAIQRGHLTFVRKEPSNKGERWLIHIEEVEQAEKWPTEEESKIKTDNSGEKVDTLINTQSDKAGQVVSSAESAQEGKIKADSSGKKADTLINTQSDKAGQVVSSADNYFSLPISCIPLDHYEKKLKEWEKERDVLRDGLNMYRFQFEELYRRVKILPVPVEMAAERINKLESDSAKIRKEKDELKTQIKKLEAELQKEQQRPWWQKIFNIFRERKPTC